LTATRKLFVHIENATRKAEEDYETALKTVAKTKEKMNELERRISQKKPEENQEHLNHLRSEIDSLNRLTDSQIMKSKETWKKYEELKHECEMQTLQPSQLDELRILCKKTEQLAADLLCYSLGFLNQKKL
jgi:transketolase